MLLVTPQLNVIWPACSGPGTHKGWEAYLEGQANLLLVGIAIDPIRFL